MHCENCRHEFEYSRHEPSYYIFCPNCCRVVAGESEYGFGQVYPVGFYLGQHRIAMLQRAEQPDAGYVLHIYGEKDIPLGKKAYPDLVREAEEILYSWLTDENFVL